MIDIKLFLKLCFLFSIMLLCMFLVSCEADRSNIKTLKTYTTKSKSDFLNFNCTVNCMKFSNPVEIACIRKYDDNLVSSYIYIIKMDNGNVFSMSSSAVIDLIDYKGEIINESN